MMKSVLRMLLVTILLPLLGGCNIVVSEQPWFTGEQATGAPRLRPGVWVNAASPDCEFDEAAPFGSLPECAGPAMVLADGTYAGLPKPEKRDRPGFAMTDPRTWDQIRHVLVAGEPMIDQLSAKDAFRNEDDDDADENGPMKSGFIYLAVEPSSFDPEGRILAVQIWLVQCGPIERGTLSVASGAKRSTEAKAENLFPVTRKPFKGLKMVDDVCMATSELALRNAASKSKSIATGEQDGVTRRRWLRDNLN